MSFIGHAAQTRISMRRNIRDIMANSKGLILTSIWMLMIICVWSEEINEVEPPFPFINYNMSKCHGTWYEVEKYNGFPLNHRRCVTIECKTDTSFTHGLFLQAAYVNVSQIFKPTREKQLLEGSIFSVVPGLVIVNINGSGIKIHQLTMVLDIDYDNYAVFSVCTGTPRFSCVSDDAVILTRQRQPSESVLQKARQALITAGIPLIRKVKIDQTNCPDP